LTERKATATRLFTEETPTQTVPLPIMKGLDTAIALPVGSGRGDVLDDCARELRQMMARVRRRHMLLFVAQSRSAAWLRVHPVATDKPCMWVV
jgi:hypothetical protein